MADLKISQLTSLAGSSLAATDELAVVDTSASETKKITSKDLVQYGYGLVDPNTLDGDIIEPGTTSARGTVQLTNSTSSTSTTTAATPNAVKAAFDLASAAMPKSGGTFTGNISFEGSTDDTFETTFAITDPTADRTITFKNESGTVAYLSDISGSAFLPLAGGTMTGQILGDDSTSASTPGYAFDGDSDTGLLRIGANELGLVTGGTPRLTIDASGNVVVPGNFTVQGTTTTIDTTTLVVKDKNIELGVVTTPTDVTADGGGITLKGSTDKTISWVDATDAWTLSEHVNIANGKEFRIAGTKVLDATSLGSSVLITSANITDGTIVNNDINASAAIAGTKVSPDFGSQNIITTGTSTAASFIPTSSTAPTNGVYLSAANRLALSTNSAGRLFINNVGQVGFNDESFSHDYSFYQATNTTLRIANSTSTTALNRGALIYLGGSDLSIANQESGFLRLLTGSSERLRITSTGDLNFVGAGTAGSTQAISISGSAAVNAVVIDSTGSVSIDNGIFYVDATNNRVGVGTVSCSATLDVGGSTATSNTGLSNVNFYAGLTPTGGGNTYGGILAGSGAGGNTPFIAASRTGAGGALPLTFFTDATERLRISSTGQLQVNSLGTATAPIWSFAADTNTGIYSPGTDQLALATGGTGRIFVNAVGNTGIGTTTTNVPLTIQADSGQASIRIAGRSADGLSYAEFTNNAQTLTYGYFSSGPTYLAAGAGTTEAIRISSTGQLQCGTLGTAAAPVISFSADTNTGIYSPGGDQVAISTGGSGRLFVDASGRIGVATASPGQRLTVGDGSATGVNYLRVHSANSDLLIGQSGGSAFGMGTSLGSIVGSDAASQPLAVGTFQNQPLLLGTNNTERARIDSSGRLGVGTSSPQVLLDVWEASDIAYSTTNTALKATGRFNNNTVGGYGCLLIQAVNGSSGGTATNCQATLNCVPETLNSRNTALTFGVRSDAVGTASERMRITSAGNVGIGTTGPASLFSVDGGNIALQSVGGSVGARTTERLFLRSDLGSTNGMAAIGMNGAGANGFLGEIKFYTGFSDFFSASLVERARIDSSGRLLVGTSTYSGAGTGFEIEGTGSFGPQIRATAKGSDQFPVYQVFRKSREASIVQNGDFIFEIKGEGFDGSTFVSSAAIRAEIDGTPGTNDMPGRLVFFTTADGASAPTERMRITQAGDTYFATTSAIAEGSGTVTGATLYNGGILGICADGQRAMFIKRLNSDGAVVNFYRTNTSVGSIAVTTTATAYNTSSDYRLKENVTVVTDGITRLQQLKPSRFNFIADPTKTVDGFLAHEVQSVVPEAITGEKDAVDDDGNPIYQGIDQSKLVPLLTAALQEAIGEIESLKARVAALESV